MFAMYLHTIIKLLGVYHLEMIFRIGFTVFYCRFWGKKISIHPSKDIHLKGIQRIEHVVEDISCKLELCEILTLVRYRKSNDVVL